MSTADKSSHDLHVFMAQLSAEMASEYGRIFARAAEDPGTAGDEGEENWATLLREWLPSNYHVETKGRLISPDGRRSPQADVLVLKPHYPRKMLEKKIWLSEGVAAVFECKTTLTAKHVKDAVKNCAVFKSLYQPERGTPFREVNTPLVYGLLAHSHSWKGSASEPIRNIDNALSETRSSVEHPRYELDNICVADLAAWARSYMYFRPHTDIQIETIKNLQRGPSTGFMCMTHEASPGHFKPIGSLISSVTNRLAWYDPSLRDIARYFFRAEMIGSGGGGMYPWPKSVLSQELLSQIPERLCAPIGWNEWASFDIP